MCTARVSAPGGRVAALRPAFFVTRDGMVLASFQAHFFGVGETEKVLAIYLFALLWTPSPWLSHINIASCTVGWVHTWQQAGRKNGGRAIHFARSERTLCAPRVGLQSTSQIQGPKEHPFLTSSTSWRGPASANAAAGAPRPRTRSLRWAKATTSALATRPSSFLPVPAGLCRMAPLMRATA